MEIDITMLSLEQFLDLVKRVTKLQNMADGGHSYICPTIRELEGQKPINMKKYVIPVNDEKVADLTNMKYLAENTPEHIVYVMMKSSSGKVLSVLHLSEAISKEAPYIKVFSYCEDN
jgi:hypothetical protein